ncbi:peroxiredoxin family protein [Cryobacterium sp. 10S3]|uniref:peroxiredoxin family protein n=3 Tax=Cryobacterium TaxID=69578 RepID=UPI002AC98A38|nr:MULTISPECIES: peroxiredoxin family protein [unclassified Cryobacterium]MEB0202530.1 peroxiredoxin family protein [Cryobacterium sp. 5I3]WPX14330.1 peroxiredoxin family protein [Cryobacterium sp. 10S3]
MSSAPKNTQKAPAARSRRPGWFGWITGLLIAGIVLAGLYGVFASANTPKTAAAGTTTQSSYDVGTPGIGQVAPGFTLADNSGGQVSLADYSGKNVLLFFQEGLACEPCWTQITSLETDAAKLQAAGIDAVVSITTDPAQQIARKTTDMGLKTPVLSDPDLVTSKKYHANEFGMMGTSTDGHSFILVGPDGTIKWRADYGGAPKYTMFVPVDQLLLDLKTDTTS